MCHLQGHITLAHTLLPGGTPSKKGQVKWSRICHLLVLGNSTLTATPKPGGTPGEKCQVKW